MQILVTGGAGFIGSHLVRALLARGEKVTVLDELNDYYPPAWKRANLERLRAYKPFEFVQGDIRDLPLCERLFRDGRFSAIVHLAARAGVRPSLAEPILYEEVNCRGTLNLLECARTTGVERFVFASSSSVYGCSKAVPFREDDPAAGPASPYGATKRAGEIYCATYTHLYGLPTLCLRFFTVYGPGQRPDMAIHKFTRLIDTGKPLPFFGDGTSRRDYTWVDDIEQGLLNSLTATYTHEIVNLGESHTTTLLDLVRMIEEGLGKKAVLERLPEQPGDVPTTYADISKARSLLGYNPTTPIDQGLERFVRWYRDTGRAWWER